MSSSLLSYAIKPQDDAKQYRKIPITPTPP